MISRVARGMAMGVREREIQFMVDLLVV